MKKQILLFTLLLMSGMVQAQFRTDTIAQKWSKPIDSLLKTTQPEINLDMGLSPTTEAMSFALSFMLYVVHSTPKPDTIACYFKAVYMVDGLPIEQWQSGYAIDDHRLFDSRKLIDSTISLQFLYSDRKTVVKLPVLQVVERGAGK